MAWRIAGPVFLGLLGTGTAFPILPLLAAPLGISAGFLALILSANRMSRVLANGPVGWLVDRLGGKLPLTAGLLVEAAAMLGFSAGLHLAGHRWWFFCARVVWGVGSSALLVGSMAAALASSERRSRGRVTSIVRAAQTLGMPFGLAYGGLVAWLFSDDVAFLSASGLAALGALVAWLTVPRRPGPDGPPGGQAFTGYLRLARDRRLVALWLANFTLFLCVQGALFATLALLVQRRQLFLLVPSTRASSGLFLAALVLTAFPAALLAGRLLDRLRRREGVALAGLGLVAAGIVLLAFSRSILPAGAAVVGLGAGLEGLNVPLITRLGDLAAAGQYGRAFGAYRTLGDLGASAGPFLGLLAAAHLGFTWTYVGTAAVLCLVTGPILLALWRAAGTTPP